MKSTRTVRLLPILLGLAILSLPSAGENKTWIDPDTARTESPDFKVQGEYAADPAQRLPGIQVVALGNGKFNAALLDDGLPGRGWTPGKQRTALTGSRTGDSVKIASTDGTVSATIRNGKLKLTRPGKKDLTLPRIERHSPTLGARPPNGAVVLFDGSSAEPWKNGRIQNGLLAAANSMSKTEFANYRIHLEFRTPFKPHARGQGRGNSGVYYGGRWETQILDSFGLEGKQNECGGIYSIASPRLNMCLPPLTWQTYDVDFTAATFDPDGKRTAWPRITVKLNGVLIHENVELAKDFTTAAPLTGALRKPEGPIFLQNHGNPVFFRNIWALPRN